VSQAKKPIGQVLKGLGLLDEAGVQRALAEQRRHGGLIGQHLVALGLVTAQGLARGLAAQAGLNAVDAEQLKPEAAALARLDPTLAHTFRLLPISEKDGVLTVALADALNTAVLEDLRFSSGLEVRAVMAEPSALAAAIERAYGAEPSLEALSRGAGAVSADPAEAAASTPVVRLLNSILNRAVRDHASDVHFEVFHDRFRIRFRVDGALYEVDSPPRHLATALVSRIKVMSDLDIAETKLPQDGRIQLSIDGRPVDLRVATLPGISGESCVLRVLDRSSVNLDLEALGFDERERKLLRAVTRLPSGIVLVTGPTGSGKTTTLYALLNEINDPGLKVITVEDPVEYDIEGVVQIPIHDDIGVTYAAVLRTVLRQDPDKILVGEVRDGETASVAIEASLTGHTVFATVHTNDAPSAVTRLLDMGLEPFLLSATLEVVLAQRLVRRICERCRSTFEPDDELLRELGPDGERVRGQRLSFGKGCEACFRTGYRGRMVLSEILLMDEEIRRAILEGESTGELRRRARSAGMRTLRDSGLSAVLAGRTTLDEVLRETGAY
jgi:type IV pilus assembly protein PilB